MGLSVSPNIQPRSISAIIPFVRGEMDYFLDLFGKIKELELSAPSGYLTEIILVNDSPHDAPSNRLLSELLDSTFCSVRLVQNQEPVGLLRSLNYGLAAAESANDLLFLHPRAILSARFFQLWQQAVCSLDLEGTNWGALSPLSNDCSFLGESSFSSNPLQLRSTTHPEDLAALCSSLFPVSEERAEILGCAPFCMLLSRHAVKRIGGFDEIFSPEFGGEADWCLRAAGRRLGSNGFSHFLIPGIFVGHSAASSFSPDAVRLADEHEILLRTRHPARLKNTIRIADRTNLEAYQRVLIPFCGFLDALQNRRVAVHLLSSRPSRHEGGVGSYVFEVTQELSAKHRVSSVCIWPFAVGPSQYIGMSVDHKPLPPLSADSFIRLLELLIAKKLLSIESLTLHQTKSWQQNSLKQIIEFFALQTRTRSIFVHDYHFLCEGRALMSRAPVFGSAAGSEEPAECSLCVHTAPAVSDIEQRLKILSRFESIVFPSEDARNLFEPLLGGLNLRRVVSTPLTLHRQDFPPPVANASLVRKINIVFFGAPAASHEARACEELVAGLSDRFNFIVIGGGDFDAAMPVRRLLLKSKRKTDLLSQLFELFPAIAFIGGARDEFSYALHDAVASRLPIVSLAQNVEIASTVRQLAIGKIFGSVEEFGQYLDRGYPQLLQDIQQCRPALTSRVNSLAIAEIYLSKETPADRAQTEMKYDRA